MPANKTYTVGLTGGIGCGKSEAADFLKRLGAAHIDADGISRELTAPGGEAIPAVRERFGGRVFREDGTLDRRALAKIVFSDESEKRALEDILHPLVRQRANEAIRSASEAGIPVTVLDVPLLFETGMDALCDEVWTMSAPEEVQIARVCERDGSTPEEAKARIGSQMPAKERERRADRVIRSDRPPEETRAELALLYRALPPNTEDHNGKNLE